MKNAVPTCNFTSCIPIVSYFTFLPGKFTYYKTAEVDGNSLTLGDYVSIAPDTPDIPPYVGRIISLFRKGGDNYLHVHWLKLVNSVFIVCEFITFKCMNFVQLGIYVIFCWVL